MRRFLTRFARTTIQPSTGEISRLLKNLGLTDLFKTRGEMTLMSWSVRASAGMLQREPARIRIVRNGFMRRVWGYVNHVTRQIAFREACPKICRAGAPPAVLADGNRRGCPTNAGAASERP